jgi:hypothetical protein
LRLNSGYPEATIAREGFYTTADRGGLEEEWVKDVRVQY